MCSATSCKVALSLSQLPCHLISHRSALLPEDDLPWSHSIGDTFRVRFKGIQHCVEPMAEVIDHMVVVIGGPVVRIQRGSASSHQRRIRDPFLELRGGFQYVHEGIIHSLQTLNGAGTDQLTPRASWMGPETK